MCGLAGMLLPGPVTEQAALEGLARRMGDALVIVARMTAGCGPMPAVASRWRTGG